MEERNKRFPRPLGTTAMVMEYNKEPSQAGLQKIWDYLINQWLISNGMLCGVTYDLTTFANMLGIDPAYIRMFMRDRLLATRIWDKEKQDLILESLLGEQLSWVMEDRMEVSHQVSLLRSSQGGSYKPFISSELNKALKLKLETSTSLQSIIRNLTGGGTTNIFNTQIDNSNNIQQQNVITVEEARSIIYESQKKLPVNEEVKLIESRYDLSELPEVVATKQEGVDTSKEGLNLNKTELNQITDNYKGALEAFSKEHHELRREIEMRYDPEDEDPELDTYVEIPEEEEKIDSIARSFLNN